MPKTLYLERANKQLVNHCRCRIALAAAPVQMDCPWCGCGWLFTCLNCRKPFTFARGVEVDESLEELAALDIAAREGTELELDDPARWVDWMQVLLKPVEPDREYVYLDGFFIDVETAPLRFDGWYSRHDLPWVPQLQALKDPTALQDTLGEQEYWEQTKLDSDA